MSLPATVTIATLLNAAGIGNIGGESGWAIYVNQQPESPNSTITVSDFGGNQPEDLLDDPDRSDVVEFPGVEIRVRCTDSIKGYAKASDAQNALCNKGPQTADGFKYLNISAQGVILSLGEDNSGRFTWLFNVMAVRTPE